MLKGQNARLTVRQREHLLQSVGFLTSFNRATVIRVSEETATCLKYLPVLRGIGMSDLAGYMRTSQLPRPIWKSDYEYWDFTEVKPGSKVDVPRTVFDRVAYAINHEVPCAGLVLVHQHVVQKVQVEHVVIERVIYVVPQLDPIMLFFTRLRE